MDDVFISYIETHEGFDLPYHTGTWEREVTADIASCNEFWFSEGNISQWPSPWRCTKIYVYRGLHISIYAQDFTWGFELMSHSINSVVVYETLPLTSYSLRLWCKYISFSGNLSRTLSLKIIMFVLFTKYQLRKWYDIHDTTYILYTEIRKLFTKKCYRYCKLIYILNI